MLSNPSAGWCDVKIGDFDGVASYLEDVPLNCLDAFIQYFDRSNSINSVSIFFDEEGTEFYAVFDYYNTYIIIERNEEPELKYIDNIGIKQLANELIKDLERDFDAWVNWTYLDDDDYDKNQRIYELRTKIDTLKELIKKY